MIPGCKQAEMRLQEGAKGLLIPTNSLDQPQTPSNSKMVGISLPASQMKDYPALIM
jgi:hypothetical protein